MNRLDQVQAYEIHVLQRPDNSHAETKSHSGYQVDILGGSDSLLHQMDGLSPHGMKQTVADETRHVTVYSDRVLADRANKLTDTIQDFGRRSLARDDFN